MKIRSITVLAQIAPDIATEQLRPLGMFAQLARRAYEEAGIEVQTARLAMDLFPALALSQWAERPVEFSSRLEEACLSHGFDYVALGKLENSKFHFQKLLSQISKLLNQEEPQHQAFLPHYFSKLVLL